jgi:hypothetical protein
MRRRIAVGFLFALLVGALPGPVAADPATGADGGTPQAPDTASAAATNLRRWLGAEGGFEETACWGAGDGCPGLSTVTSFGGDLRSQRTMTEIVDADGVRRAWPARTGNRLFIASVPGATTGVAYLSTNSSGTVASAPLTLSFGIRFHAPPVEPVVVYRHAGDSPLRSVALAVSPAGELMPFLGGLALEPTAALLRVGKWHTITITYGAEPQAPLRIYIDDELTISGVLPFGGPSGRLDLGIVAAPGIPTVLGIDDIVEASGFDAPIRGARVHYLMPLGQVGEEKWGRSHPVPACRSAANWRYVSEDQTLRVGGETCTLGDGALVASEPGLVDQLTLEGVPSSHKPSSSYARAVYVQPVSGSDVLGVRLRMRGRTDGPTLTWGLSFTDGGSVVRDEFSFDDGGTGGAVTRWGATRTTRPSGTRWTAAALDGLRLRLDSGTSGSGQRRVTEVRLDYVWVP